MRDPKISLLVIAAIVLCGMTPRAWAGAKEEVAAATAKWAEAFAADTPGETVGAARAAATSAVVH